MQTVEHSTVAEEKYGLDSTQLNTHAAWIFLKALLEFYSDDYDNAADDSVADFDEDDDEDEDEEVVCKAKLFTRLFHLDSGSY